MYNRISYKGVTIERSINKPAIIHHLNDLTLGGTEKMVQTNMGYFVKDNTFEHYLAYKSGGDLAREDFFKEILGDRMLPYKDEKELISIVENKKPFIIHRYSAGIPEFPFIKEVKENTEHFVSTSTFGNQDNTIDISKVIYVSKHIQWQAAKAGTAGHHVIGIPVKPPAASTNLREELDIPKDAFVFGRIGRDDENIYDPINIEAYAKIATSNTCFVIVNPSGSSRRDIERLNIKSVRFVERIASEVRVSEFYNTIDVLAHARKDGECSPQNVWEAFAHGKPVISHYGHPFNGHVEVIQDCGFIVLRDDVDEYARVMNKFIKKEVDYFKLSKKCINNWKEHCMPNKIAKEQLGLYKELL
jgi:glycosyltransferase involved in cell wall biosynthesis|tara:strand:+ start:601 stop:1677 length:1077 start_codon:yes stop_codon:yes gene_type:complete